MIYHAVRPLLFSLDAERSHDLTLGALSNPLAAPLVRACCGKAVDDPVDLLGLRFANRIGLAAGLDKDARAVDAFGAMGFGFLEVGTVTPVAQPGNTKPRLFRLTERDALINRFGFNNLGVDALVKRVNARRWSGVLGVNIGKNAVTPAERATDDYISCLQAVAPVADYVTINISSPNTKNLRDLQQSDALGGLLSALTAERDQQVQKLGRALPLLLKVAPDMDDDQRAAIASLVTEYRIDGVIASNTTVDREAVTGLQHGDEAGGLSGGPLRSRTAPIINTWRKLLGPDTALIAVGGIASGDDARAACDAGADLVQVYTGLIYEGPGLVPRVARALKRDSKPTQRESS